MKWDRVKIKDICIGIYDGPHATPQPSESGAIFLGISNFNDGKLDLSDIRYISEADLPAWTKRVVPKPNDIVFSYEATLNLYAIIPEGFRGCLGRRMALLRTDESKVYYKFLYYYFYSDAWRAVIQANTVLGATVDRIPLTKFPEFEVNLPKLESQHRIADILSSYDNLIENNQKQIKLLEEAAQRLYKEWFVDLHFPGYENVPVVDGAPEGWAVQPLSEIADVIMGQSPKSEFYNQDHNGLPFHQGVSSYGTRFVIDGVYSTSYTRVAEANSILFSVRAPVGRINITRNRIVIGRGLAALKHKSGYQSYLFYLLKHCYFKDNVVGNGSVFPAISRDELLKQNFLIPPTQLIQAFDDLAERLDQRIATLDKQMRLLEQVRNGLLPKLMSGELEV